MAISAAATTVVDSSLLVLLAGFGSGVSLFTVAPFRYTPITGRRTRSVTVWLASGAMLPRLQLKVAPTSAVHVPAVVTASIKTALLGNVSVSTTFKAVSVALLLFTRMV